MKLVFKMLVIGIVGVKGVDVGFVYFVGVGDGCVVVGGDDYYFFREYWQFFQVWMYQWVVDKCGVQGVFQYVVDYCFGRVG